MVYLSSFLGSGLSPLNLPPATAPTDSTALNRVPIIAGVAAGVVVLLAVVGTAVTLLLARKHQMKRSLPTRKDNPQIDSLREPAVKDPEGDVELLTTANPAYHSVGRGESVDQQVYEYPMPTEPVAFLLARKHQMKRSLPTLKDSPQIDSLQEPAVKDPEGDGELLTTANPAYNPVGRSESVDQPTEPVTVLLARKCHVKQSLPTLKDSTMKDQEDDLTSNPVYNSVQCHVDGRDYVDQLVYDYPRPTEPTCDHSDYEMVDEQQLYTEIADDRPEVSSTDNLVYDELN